VVGLLPSGTDQQSGGREATNERGEGPSHATAAAVGSNVYRAERPARGRATKNAVNVCLSALTTTITTTTAAAAAPAAAEWCCTAADNDSDVV